MNASITENTYANTGANLSLNCPPPPPAGDDTPPPPPKSRPPAVTPPPPVTATTDPPDRRRNQKAAESQCSHSSLPRPTSRSQTSSHEPHYQTHSLNRRTAAGSSSSSSSSAVRQGASTGLTSCVRSYVKSPGAGTTFSAATPTPFDEEFLCQLPVEDLVARIKILEAKNRKLVLDNGQMMKNLNQHISTLQTLKYQNFRLTSDNNELRDLTVYLDDERNRTRGLAKQWQDFGNHMSKVMKHEVSNYAKKLHQLEDKQFELVRENFELRQLCVLMDKAMNMRGENNADIASSGSNASSADGSNGNGNMISHRGQNHVMISQQILEYIRSLEQRISQLEWEKKQVTGGGGQEDVNSNSVTTSDSVDQGIGSCTYDVTSAHSTLTPPAIILEAMRSLRMRETLSPSSTSSTLKDTTAASSTTSSFRSRSVSPRKSSTRI